ncbi:MAG TPA: SDR family oxidoreductase [Kofleriaceae bacterium]|jgi:peroxisomal 2,4-dienoyl-CoA reductase|nr:SDR family oxidoreductase [Kofleriaceae bacterium]
MRTGPLAIFADDLLKGHTAIVTGGGSGICRGIARAFSVLGADVCITSRKQAVLDEASAAISAESGRAVLGVAADVRNPDELAKVVATAAERFGGLDTFVNGAAGNFLAPAAALSPNGFKTVIDIDLLGSFHGAKAAFELLRASKRGVLINVSATLHYHGTPLQIHASAAKAGVDAITRNLAVEWGQFGIRVVGIAPGPIAETEGMRKLAPGDAAQKMMKAIPLQRWGTIEEIAASAVFLRSSAAEYITGAIFVVDGGQSISQGMFGM